MTITDDLHDNFMLPSEPLLSMALYHTLNLESSGTYTMASNPHHPANAQHDRLQVLILAFRQVDESLSSKC